MLGAAGSDRAPAEDRIAGRPGAVREGDRGLDRPQGGGLGEGEPPVSSRSVGFALREITQITCCFG